MSRTQAPLTVSAVAARLGVSPARVRELNGELRPRRTETGVRLYRQDAVDGVAKRLAERRRPMKRASKPAATLAEALAKPFGTDRYRLLELAALEIHDAERAEFWARQQKKSDYSLPPGMPRARALEIARWANVSSTTDAALRGSVDVYLESMIRRARQPQLAAAAMPAELRTDASDLELRLLGQMAMRADEERRDAEERDRAAAWDGRWKRPAKSSTLADTPEAGHRPPPARSRARHDEAPAAAAWGDEWKRRPRSDAFVADAVKEAAGRGGFATAELPTAAPEDEDDELDPRLDDSDADQPVLERQQRAAAPDPAASANAREEP